ncbi:MAG TPA: chemotaxis protein CheW [Mobilitalea sp.]|nr:chemotaxis protein CheW [Mobilitalea sp.]
MAANESKQFIITYLNKQQYGIDIKYIDNIIVMQGITRVPKAQSFFKGVINLRGEIMPVMSLRLKLGIPEEAYTSKSRIIIVRPEPQAAPVGLIVDEVKEVITLETDSIEKMTYDEKDGKANYSIGIGKFGSDLINLLSISSIVLEKEATN